MGRRINSNQGNVRIIVTVVIGLFLAISVGVIALLYQGSSEGQVTDVIIPRGTSLKTVSEILHEQGVIERTGMFKFLLRFSGGSSRVRAGEFRFKKQMRPIDALMVLYHDAPIVHQVTVPEGYNVRQIAELLATNGLANSKRFLELAMSKQAAAQHGLPGPNLEGFLYPDTYAFSKIDTEEKIIERMVVRFREILDSDLGKDPAFSRTDLLRIVTLASIIEKETGAPEERPLISSVFHNRIKKKMRLQSDPTTIYGITDFDGNLKKIHLQTYSPYNTYVINGLPPGAICSPGLASLKAVLHPADSKFLYFVSTNNGHHVFSETYAQHSRHVNNYQERRSGRKKSARERKGN